MTLANHCVLVFLIEVARCIINANHCLSLAATKLRIAIRRRYFFGTHDETLTLDMRVNDPDRSPFEIKS
jgi:hypothetical protein